MPAKKDLAGLLGGGGDTPLPEIRRGQGMRLSTEQDHPQGQDDRTNAETQDRTNAETQDRTNAETQDRTNAETQDRTNAETQDRTNAQSRKGAPEARVRINRGYALREDLVKDLKRVALDEDRKLYEVMDEALEQYLARRRASVGDEPL